MLTKTAIDPKTNYRCPWIEGYCSRTSVKAGEKINATEKRAVFHVGLRGSADAVIDGKKVSDVVAAPDLVRFTIAGSGPSGMSGQVLWSRTRGVVFSGVRHFRH